jgi:NitT/TauT family transport system permease protein
MTSLLERRTDVEPVPAPVAGHRERPFVDFVVGTIMAIVWPCIALLAIVAVWALAVRLSVSNSLLLPTPADVAQAARDNWEILIDGLAVTMWESFLGFVISIVAGVLLALFIVTFRTAERVILPVLTLLNAAPKIVFAPILIIWLGIGTSSKVALAILLAFFPIVISCIRGLSDVSPELLEFWHLMRANRLRVLWEVRLPNSLPYLYNGCLIALPMAIVGAVIGEFVASEGGIGHVIIIAYSQLDTAMVFAATILISVVSTIAFLLLRASEPLVIRWTASVRSEGGVAGG